MPNLKIRHVLSVLLVCLALFFIKQIKLNTELFILLIPIFYNCIHKSASGKQK